MTEEKWLSADDVNGMVAHLGDGKEKERKYRLFALECVRVIRDRLRDTRSLAALEFVEANAEELFRSPVDENLRHRRRRVLTAAAAANEAAQATRRTAEGDDHCHPDTWNQIFIDAYAAASASWLLSSPPSTVAVMCARHAEGIRAAEAREPYQPGVQARNSWEPAERQRRLNVAWFRDIFGNPFRPVAFDPAWWTDAAVSLARQMYEGRDFSLMPILADALEDAGCEHPDVLDHCRDPDGTHVRGCWVVDLVLGKQ